jgi:DNA-directed RNA polymerase subunit RPC12/RpoP
MRWRVIAKQLVPSRGTLILLWLALGVLFFGSICALTAGLSRQVDDPIGVALAILGAGVLPVCALVAVVGAIREKGSAARALLWLLAWASIGGSGGLISLGIARDPDVGLESAALCYTCTCAPASLVFFIPAGRMLLKAWPELKRALAAERERAAIELVEQRGEIGLGELGAALDLDAARTLSLVQASVQTGRLAAEIDTAQSKVYATAHLHRQQERLLGIVGAHGRISLDELGRELGVPRETLKAWIYELVRRGRFAGALNWSAGMLYSAEAQQLNGPVMLAQAGIQALAYARCPHCGGELALAGVGVVSCQYCGAEVFLQRHNENGRT